MVIFATLFGISLTRVNSQQGKVVLSFFEAVAQVMFKYTDMVMRLTPIGGGKKLEVRGSIGPFGRTQTWVRVP